MTDTPEPAAPSTEGRAFRWILGLLVLFTAISGFFALFYFKIPPENKDAFVFALGSVFGWAASVVGSEYGATTTGRKVAESAIRSIEQRDAALADAPRGTPEDPLAVAGAAQDQPPVDTKVKKP